MNKPIGRPKKSRDIQCVCKHCGKHYGVPEYSKTGRVYCSKECVDAAKRGKPRPGAAPHVAHTCQTCAVVFHLPPGRQTGHKYCSAACYHRDIRGKKPSEPGADNCTCLNCAQHFVVPKWKKVGRTYCSLECYHHDRIGKASTKRMDPVPATCEACNSTFMTGGQGRPRIGAKFCSRACQGEGMSQHPPLRQMSPEEIAWLAGLFDGEGNIAWPRKGNVYAVRVSITNTCFELLERIKAVTGTGSICSYRDAKSILHRPAQNWACTGDRARAFLQATLPWLIVKKHNAEIVMRAIDAWREGRDFAEVPQYSRLEAISLQKEKERLHVAPEASNVA